MEIVGTFSLFQFCPDLAQNFICSLSTEIREVSLRLYQSNIHHPAYQTMLSRTPVPRGASSLCIMTFTGPVTSALFSP